MHPIHAVYVGVVYWIVIQYMHGGKHSIQIHGCVWLFAVWLVFDHPHLLMDEVLMYAFVRAFKRICMYVCIRSRGYLHTYVLMLGCKNACKNVFMYECMYLCMYALESISIYVSRYLPNFLLFCLSNYPPIYLSISIYLAICLYIYLSI